MRLIGYCSLLFGALDAGQRCAMSVRPGAAPPNGKDTKIIFLAGAVAHWWYDNWESPQHYEYMQWRHDVEVALVAHGYLVYKHFDAFKGTWTDRAQEINEFALQRSDLMVVMTGEDIPSEGTDAEIMLAEHWGIPWVRVPSSLGLVKLIEHVAEALDKPSATR
jgi:hypothetical protein